MKKLFTLVSLIFLSEWSVSQNLTLDANLPYGFMLANIGGYVDNFGTEYALVGTWNGLSIVDVSTPSSPVEMFAVPGLPSEWREVKTWQHYAYVTTEAGDGLQIVNLQYLPDSVQVTQYHGDGAISSQLETIHALHIDNGYVYLYGSNLFNGAAVICDLNADPWNPHYLGHTPGSYIHDGYVRNDTLYAGHIYDGEVGIYNCNNKANPVLLASQNTPNFFPHNTWLSADSHIMFTTDETSDSYLTSYDISDLANIQELNRFQTTPGSGSIVHNTHIIDVNGGEFAVTSWYYDGVVITDVSRPQNMVQVGRYDTYPQATGGGFNGCWGVYPYLPSGTIVAADMSNGLFVLTPTYIRACYLEGNVTDSITGFPLNNVTVTLLSTTDTTLTKITGDYKTGIATAGTYDILFTRTGYFPKTITSVSLTNAVVTTLDVQLASVPSIAISGQVIEAGTGNPVANAQVLLQNIGFTNYVTANASGNFSISNFSPGTYDITAGKWGYHTNCTSGNVINGTSGPVTITLTRGYYDDFTFDFGWTVSGTSPNSWERGVPYPSFYNGYPANAYSDVTTDCGSEAFVTDNGAGNAWDHSVSNGSTILTSPVFNAAVYSNPHLLYNRWFADLDYNGAVANDSMWVKITNGITTVTLEKVGAGASNWQWASKTYILNNFIAPTANMQLIVEVAELAPGFSIVEGGIDKFQIIGTIVSVEENSVFGNLLKAFPNPFNNDITITINAASLSANATINITDVEGKVLMEKLIDRNQSSFKLGNQFSPGMYFVRVKDSDKTSQVIKIVKID